MNSYTLKVKSFLDFEWSVHGKNCKLFGILSKIGDLNVNYHPNSFFF